MTATERPDILVLVGSPRENGKSAKLAEALAARLEDKGAKLTVWHLAKYPVAACNGCGACAKTGACSIMGDPFNVLSRHMDSADALVLVAPLYFAGPTGWLKAALDRCQVYWARRYVLNMPMPPRRPAHLLVVGDGGDPFGSAPLETICASALNSTGLRIAEERTHRFIGADYDLARVPGIVESVLDSIGQSV